MLQDHHISPFPSSRNSHFAGIPNFFYREWQLETNIWVLGVFIAIMVLVLLGPLSGPNWEIEVFILTNM